MNKINLYKYQPYQLGTYSDAHIIQMQNGYPICNTDKIITLLQNELSEQYRMEQIKSELNVPVSEYAPYIYNEQITNVYTPEYHSDEEIKKSGEEND